MTAMALHWLNILSVFVQNGNYQPAIVFLCTAGIVMAYMVYKVLFVVVEPMYAALTQSITSFRRLMICLFGVFSIGQIGLGIAKVVYCTTDDEMFNALYCAYFFLSGCFYCIPCTIVLVQTYRLEKLIRHTNSHASDDVRMFVEQLRSLRKVVLRGLFNSIIFAIPIGMLIIGSMPYNFLFWAFQVSTLWPASRQAVNFLRSKNKTSGGASSRTSKNSLELLSAVKTIENNSTFFEYPWLHDQNGHVVQSGCVSSSNFTLEKFV